MPAGLLGLCPCFTRHGRRVCGCLGIEASLKHRKEDPDGADTVSWNILAQSYYGTAYRYICTTHCSISQSDETVVDPDNPGHCHSCAKEIS